MPRMILKILESITSAWRGVSHQASDLQVLLLNYIKNITLVLGSLVIKLNTHSVATNLDNDLWMKKRQSAVPSISSLKLIKVVQLEKG